jgi:hypothetical protein
MLGVKRLVARTDPAWGATTTTRGRRPFLVGFRDAVPVGRDRAADQSLRVRADGIGHRQRARGQVTRSRRGRLCVLRLSLGPRHDDRERAKRQSNNETTPDAAIGVHVRLRRGFISFLQGGVKDGRK